MRLVLAAAALLLIAADGTQPTGTPAPAVGSARTELQRHDLSVPGREAIQVRVDFGPGQAAPRHRHPGEELVYVLSGSFEYELEGRRQTVAAGETLFIPAGTVHAARNLGSATASELATYIVEKGQPLVVLAE